MKKLLLFLYYSFFFAPTIYADIVGSEITYACTASPGIVEVTLVLYRDCSGVPLCSGTCGAPCQQQLTIKGADAGCSNQTFGNITLSLQNVRDVDVKARCPNTKNTCTNRGCVIAGIYYPNFERYEFKGFANIGPTSGIPATCCNVRFDYALCCRYSNINTGASGEDFYIDAIVNRCLSLSPCNSSPVIKSDPSILVIGGQNHLSSNAATDPDNDSLSYQFAPAFKAFNMPVTYTSPFAYNKPVPWTGNATGLYPQGIHMDPLNGDLMFTPPNSGSYFNGIIATEIKQWKTINGVPTVIGITRRDILVMITGNSSPNNPPRFTTDPPEDGNVNVPKTNWNVCEDEQLCFTVTAKDTDFNPPALSDSTFMRWDSALANLGATFSPDYDPAKRYQPDSLGGGPREDRYKFCWTPTSGMARSNPYYFTVSAFDSRCPEPGKLARSFSITVSPKASAQIQQTNTACQQALLSYDNTTPAVPIIDAFWHIAKVPNDSTFSQGFDTYVASTTPTPYFFKNSGRFYIRLNVIGKALPGLPGCSKTYSSYIDAAGILLKDSIQTTDLTCAVIPSGKIELKGYNGTAPYQYKLNNQPYTTNNTFPNLMAGKYITWVKDAGGCETPDTVLLSQPLTLITTIKSTAPLCFNDSNGSIKIQTTGGIPPYTFQFNQQGFQSDSVFTNLASGMYRLTVKDANACIQMDSVVLQNPATIRANYTVTPTSCFNGNNGKISISPQVGKAPFMYRLNQQQAQTTPLYENLQAATYLVTLIDSNVCSHSDSITVSQPSAIRYTKNKKPITCYNDNDGHFAVIPTGGTPPYQLLFDSILHSEPYSVFPVKPGNYRYQIIDSKNCKIEGMDTFVNPEQVIAGAISGDINVMVNTTHTYSVPNQQNIFFFWQVYGGKFLSSSMNPPSVTVLWDSVGLGMISIEANNFSGCYDTSALQINIGSVGLTELTTSWGLNVYPNPAKNLLNISLQDLPEQTQIQLFDMQGKLVLQQELKLSQQLNIETLTPGMYLLKIGAWSGQVVKE